MPRSTRSWIYRPPPHGAHRGATGLGPMLPFFPSQPTDDPLGGPGGGTRAGSIIHSGAVVGRVVHSGSLAGTIVHSGAKVGRVT